MKIFQSLLTSSLISLLVDQTEGWSCLPPSPVKKIKDIGRKSFLIGAASGFVLGTTATAAGGIIGRQGHSHHRWNRRTGIGKICCFDLSPAIRVLLRRNL
jgi:hypothetical protein